MRGQIRKRRSAATHGFPFEEAIQYVQQRTVEPEDEDGAVEITIGHQY